MKTGLIALLIAFLYLLMNRKNENMLSENFTYSELVRTNTGIPNNPNEIEKENLKTSAQNVLQPIRDAWGSPVIVTSGYRSKAVNDAVRGVDDSKHTKGLAFDIKPKSGSIDELFEMIQRMPLSVKAILETGRYGEKWIHVEVLPEGSTSLFLVANWDKEKEEMIYGIA